MEDTASDAGYTVVFCNTDESDVEERKYLQVLLQQQVDGILLVPARSASASLEVIRKQGYPRRGARSARCRPERMSMWCAARMKTARIDLIRLLIELGHQRIAILSGPMGVSTAEDRLAGYQRAMAETGLPPDSKPDHLRRV